jgi:hypothetical protein
LVLLLALEDLECLSGSFGGSDSGIVKVPGDQDLLTSTKKLFSGGGSSNFFSDLGNRREWLTVTDGLPTAKLVELTGCLGTVTPIEIFSLDVFFEFNFVRIQRIEGSEVGAGELAFGEAVLRPPDFLRRFPKVLDGIEASPTGDQHPLAILALPDDGRVEERVLCDGIAKGDDGLLGIRFSLTFRRNLEVRDRYYLDCEGHSGS